MSFYAFIGALEQGLVYGLMVLGVYLTFRILDFPDLTVDGSLPLGAAVSSVCIGAGMDPYLSLVPATLAGFCAGAVTGLLNTRLKILHLLASILTMIALYSINIRIMGRPNFTLLGKSTVLDSLTAFGLPSSMAGTCLFAAFTVSAALALIWFTRTELGQAMLATGDNPRMITALGVNTGNMIVLGVGLSNALVALCGALVAQNQGAADVNMGVGTIVAGLASVIIGETLLGQGRISRMIIAAVLGSVAYRLAIALALGVKLGEFSFSPSDLNLITAFIVVAALTAPRLKRKMAR
ncbi:ABC transporter permease [Fundidesulfovibrio agrisoli]|uniref:ABC transporter permease n=1 Tax=Fundidesulfovibrio agrisoli TaxID=2922717 RepID=UPI001FAE58D8|nr:ABC transporter permease [Fundidesulfovibrio agrisoli]